MVESDKIDFGVNFLDTTIQGPKKILKYATTSGTVSYNTTQFYECAPNTDCAGKLTFPQKHLVKLVVEPSVAQSEENELVWTEVVAAAGKHLTNIESYGWYDITHDGNNTWMTFRLSCGITAISINNGTVWNARGYLPSPASSWQGIAHDGNDTWMAINSTGAIAISINDGTSWTLQNNNLSSISDNHWYAIAHGGNNTWMALNNNGPIAINNGTSWTLRGSLSSISNNNYWYAIAHVGNNTWMALNNNGLIAISTNDGMDWTQWSSDLSSISSSIINNNIWRDIAHDGNNTWMAINSTGAIAISANDGANWTLQGNLSSISNSNGWYSITHDGNNIWMAVNTDGKVAVGTSDTTGTIKFTNATPIGVTQNSECELTERREFYIQPTQISDTEGAEDYSIAFDMKNVRLISAEITNRPYSVTSNVLTYDALQLPEMSRVVDFSQKTLANELVYNIGSLQKLNSTNDYISYGADATELSSIDICWNAGISRWELCQNASGYSDKNYLRANTVPGDFFLVTDMETTPNATSYHKILLDSTNSINDYFGIGLNRSFWPSFSHLNTSLEGQCGYRWKTYNIDALPMIFAGLTLPINATLYHGFGSDNEGEGGWYINGGDMDYDATHACQRLTTSACAQLQAAYGANLRIYVVKYRKQTKFKHKITGVADSFNYSYIDACATYSKDVYDADEFTLQDRLQDIANDIKSWAAYAPAKLCDD
jgi:hypothetical protein